ncbi:MAG: DNA polymerase IV [Clostridia bacterium]|nr:DNA polymerase IV [Clostridia bacterium]
MKDRCILHIDMNNFFATVECRGRDDLVGKPVAVGGDAEARHGIILAKNYEAKSYGIRTGESILEAKKKCPKLVILPAHYDEYIKVSRAARKIYSDYTNLIESFGIDECWIDVTDSEYLFGGGERIADEIRGRIKRELGVTVSVGVSFNKVFAKLGSDMKKPDATTVISRENFKNTVWVLPAEDLLFVGRATKRRINTLGIYTIGDLATADSELLLRFMGKNGIMLQNFALGRDNAPVLRNEAAYPVKSVGNSTTAPRDIKTEREAEIVFAVLCESVAVRLRAEGKKCTTVRISVRSSDLSWFSKQCRVEATFSEREIYRAAVGLYRESFKGGAVRSLGVCGADLCPERDEQISIFEGETVGRARLEVLERTADTIRSRFGKYAIRRGLMLEDKTLSGFCPYDEHTVHPIALRT